MKLEDCFFMACQISVSFNTQCFTKMLVCRNNFLEKHVCKRYFSTKLPRIPSFFIALFVGLSRDAYQLPCGNESETDNRVKQFPTFFCVPIVHTLSVWIGRVRRPSFGACFLLSCVYMGEKVLTVPSYWCLLLLFSSFFYFVWFFYPLHIK